MSTLRQFDLSSAMDQLWTRFLPIVLERISDLETAASALEQNRLTGEKKEQALAAAHKLAGTLGTFNLERGTELAREMEALFAAQDQPDSGPAARMRSLVAELRSLVEHRPQG